MKCVRFVSLRLAGARSLQRHRSQPLSIHGRAVRSGGGLQGAHHLDAVQRQQTVGMVCPTVAENGSQ